MNPRLRNPEVIGRLLMAAAVLIAAAYIVWLQRGLIFASDEYLWLELSGLGDFGYFWRPYGGHLIVSAFVLWRGILEVFGTDFAAFTAFQVAGLSTSATLLYIYAKRRIGPILALCPAIILLFLGAAWSPLLQPMIGIQFLLALVPGLGAILMLEREDRRGDVIACLLLCLALMGFSQAVAFLAGAAVWIAIKPGWRNRAWVVLIPAVLYGAWHIWARKYGAEPITGSNIPWTPLYISDSLGVVATSIFGQGGIFAGGHWTSIRLNGYDFAQLCSGIVILLIEILIVGRAIWLVRRREGGLPRSFWPAVAILLTLWALQATVFTSTRTPGEVRYMYAGTLLLLLVVLELFRGIETTRWTVAAAAVLTVAALVGNLPQFREGRRLLDSAQASARADMTVIELGGDNVRRSFTPNIDAADLVDSGLSFNTGPWRKVVRRYGGFEDSIAELEARPEPVRAQADQVAARALELKLEPLDRAARGCRRQGGGTPVELVLPPGGAVLEASDDTAVSLRRWAGEFATPLGRLQGGRPARLRIPSDEASQVPWRVQLTETDSALICRP